MVVQLEDLLILKCYLTRTRRGDDELWVLAHQAAGATQCGELQQQYALARCAVAISDLQGAGRWAAAEQARRLAN